MNDAPQFPLLVCPKPPPPFRWIQFAGQKSEPEKALKSYCLPVINYTCIRSHYNYPQEVRLSNNSNQFIFRWIFLLRMIYQLFLYSPIFNQKSKICNQESPPRYDRQVYGLPANNPHALLFPGSVYFRIYRSIGSFFRRLVSVGKSPSLNHLNFTEARPGLYKICDFSLTIRLRSRLTHITRIISQIICKQVARLKILNIGNHHIRFNET